MNLSESDIDHCITTLESLIKNSEPLAFLPEEKRISLLTAAGLISHPSAEEAQKRKNNVKKARRLMAQQNERKARALTGIREARKSPVFIAPKQLPELTQSDPESEHVSINGSLNSHRNCYVCKAEYNELHFFYDSMCKSCGDFNYKKRFQSAPLTGKVAVITGSRLKIGFHATLMMLRAGARVIA
ncbi:MAG: hypothetical protein ACHQVK_04450, partial [Candidatus Paceibacterales bacterium]